MEHATYMVLLPSSQLYFLEIVTNPLPLFFFKWQQQLPSIEYLLCAGYFTYLKPFYYKLQYEYRKVHKMQVYSLMNNYKSLGIQYPNQEKECCQHQEVLTFSPQLTLIPSSIKKLTFLYCTVFRILPFSFCLNYYSLISSRTCLFHLQGVFWYSWYLYFQKFQNQLVKLAKQTYYILLSKKSNLTV